MAGRGVVSPPAGQEKRETCHEAARVGPGWGLGAEAEAAAPGGPDH